MRIRHLSQKGRMLCLLLLSIWSFAVVFFLWNQLQVDESDFMPEDDYNGVVYKILKKKRNADFMKINLKFSPRRRNKRKTRTLPTQWKQKFLKISSLGKDRMTKGVDYGRNRDVEVEGVNDYIMWHENFKNKPLLPTLPRQRRCTAPCQNIAFVKTHYTGSNVITNILNRYGDLNNLNMALPNDGLSTFFWPMRFQWKYIDITLLNGSLPNIVANHARYNNDVMDNILHPGSRYVTILRDPATQLETTFNNLGFGELLEIWNTTEKLKRFLDNPKYYIQRVIKAKRFRDTLNLIKNGQFFDLGLSTTDYHRQSIIKLTIQELYDKFTLVLIYEHIDESLVLMKRRFCWELDDILYLKFHDADENMWNKEIPDELQEKIRKWNQADTQLYSYFNRTLWTEIQYEGQEFWDELKEFRKLKETVEADCVGKKNEARQKFFLDEHEIVEELNIPNTRQTRLYLNSFMRMHSQFDTGSGEGLVQNGSERKVHGKNEKTSRDGQLLTDLSEDMLDGSGSYIISHISTTERILNKQASSWNNYFCKKLILRELEYLDYFRKKHAYAKSMSKRL